MHQPPGPLYIRNLTAMRQPVHPSSPLLPVANALRHAPTSALPHLGSIVAVIAPCESASDLADALVALDNQTRPPDAIVAVVDRESDAVAIAALTGGATVIETDLARFGRYGALSLVLSELLDVLDDTDVILLMSGDIAPEPLFTAAAVRHVWPISPSSRAVRTRTTALVEAVIGTEARPEGLVRAECTTNHHRIGDGVAVATVAALRMVCDRRRDGSLPDRTGTAGVFDLHAIDPPTELTVALRHIGARVTTDPACRFRRVRRPGLSFTSTSERSRHLHHGQLDAARSHGLSRPLVRTHLGAVTSMARLTLVPLLLITLIVGVASGASLPMAIPVIGLAVAIWSASLGWSRRHAGWRQAARAACLLPWAVQAIAVGWGRLRGTARWVMQRPSTGPVSQTLQSDRRIEAVRINGAPLTIKQPAHQSDVLALLPRLAIGAVLFGLPLGLVVVLAVTATSAAWTVAMMALIGTTVFWATRTGDADPLIGVVRLAPRTNSRSGSQRSSG